MGGGAPPQVDRCIATPSRKVQPLAPGRPRRRLEHRPPGRGRRPARRHLHHRRPRARDPAPGRGRLPDHASARAGGRAADRHGGPDAGAGRRAPRRCHGRLRHLGHPGGPQRRRRARAGAGGDRGGRHRPARGRGGPAHLPGRSALDRLLSPAPAGGRHRRRQPGGRRRGDQPARHRRELAAGRDPAVPAVRPVGPGAPRGAGRPAGTCPCPARPARRAHPGPRVRGRLRHLQDLPHPGAAGQGPARGAYAATRLRLRRRRRADRSGADPGGAGRGRRLPGRHHRPPAQPPGRTG